jgi:hypothetical protein
MGYALAYKNDADKAVCEIFENWHTMFKRFEQLDSMHKTVYEIVQGPNEPTGNSSEV